MRAASHAATNHHHHDRPWPEIDGLILDMDGTVYRGDVPIAGAFETIAECRRVGLPVMYVTNNSTKSRAEFAAKLTQLGADTDPTQIINTAHATGQLLSRRYEPGTAVYVIGADALSSAIAEAGYEVTSEGAEVVVVGLDREFTYDKLRRAVHLILDGADFVATNPDRLVPHGPNLDPGAGTLMAAVHAATAHVTNPLVVGKPETNLMVLAMQALGTLPEHTVMVGDQLMTDIQAGQRAGLFSVLTTTGVPPATDSAIIPDRVITTLRDIPIATPNASRAAARSAARE